MGLIWSTTRLQLVWWAARSPGVREFATDSAVGRWLQPASLWVSKRVDFVFSEGGADASIWASTGINSRQTPTSAWEDGRLGGRIGQDILQGVLKVERRRGYGRLEDLDLKFLWQAELGLLVIVRGSSRDLE